jgi:hypothetical protein
MAIFAYAFLQHQCLSLTAKRGKRSIAPPPEPTLPAERHAITAHLLQMNQKASARAMSPLPNGDHAAAA